jgi:putative transposase
MIYAHQIALDLTQAQETYCKRAAGTARFVYNWALAEWQRQYQAGEKPTAQALKTQWNTLKHEAYPWVAEVHKDANQQPFAHLATVFHKFFRHEAGYPTFKKKGQHDSFYISNDKCQIRGKRLRLPTLGWVRMREALRFTGKVMAVTVSRIAQRWYASISVQVETAPAVCENQATVGVDLGVLRLATFSTGETVEGPKPLRRLRTKLQRCSRQLSRKVKGSRNCAKARDRLARLHARIASQRKDALHKLSTDLVRRFGVIVLEDLHVKGMVRNRHLARAISRVIASKSQS